MPAGTKKADIYAVFSQRLQALRDYAAAAAAAAQQAGPRQWCIPPGMADSASSLQDIANLHKAGFDRSEINTGYEQCFQTSSNPGTTGDVIGTKLQCDYNAAEERAFRFRHATPVRCLVHAAGRRQGDAGGPVFRHIEETTAAVINSGASGKGVV